MRRTRIATITGVSCAVWSATGAPLGGGVFHGVVKRDAPEDRADEPKQERAEGAADVVLADDEADGAAEDRADEGHERGPQPAPGERETEAHEDEEDPDDAEGR